MSKYIMPLKLYNANCPYCGSIDSIDIRENKAAKYLGKNDHLIVTAKCMKCDKSLAVHYEEDGNYLSDIEYSMDTFLKEFIDYTDRDIDTYLYGDL